MSSLEGKLNTALKDNLKGDQFTQHMSRHAQDYITLSTKTVQHKEDTQAIESAKFLTIFFWKAKYFNQLVAALRSYREVIKVHIPETHRLEVYR